jgi:hypothetical protein
VLTVDINHHTGSGTYASWVVNVGGVVPATSVTWGSITGTLGSQTDLATALNAKLEVTTAASTYAPLANPSLTGTPLSTTAAADTNTTQIATTAFVVGQASSTAPAATGTAAVGTSLRYARADHVHANPLPTGGTTGQVLSKVDGTNYNTTWTTVSGGAATWGSITGTLSSQTDLNTALGTKANLAGAQFTGKVGMGVAADATAALKVDANGIMFNDSTTQTTAASTFSGGGVNNPVTYFDGFNTVYLGTSGRVGAYNGNPQDTYIQPTGLVLGNSATITFSDGTTQSTAPTGMSAPTSSNAIWYGSTWYSANVYSIYDSGTMSSINVLGF